MSPATCRLAHTCCSLCPAHRSLPSCPAVLSLQVGAYLLLERHAPKPGWYGAWVDGARILAGGLRSRDSLCAAGAGQHGQHGCNTSAFASIDTMGTRHMNGNLAIRQAPARGAGGSPL